MKNCTKGKPCGATCISLNRKCVSSLATVANKILEELQKEVVRTTLTDEENLVVHQYTGMSYSAINTKLRDPSARIEGFGMRGPHQIEVLDQVLEKLPPAPNAKLSRIESYKEPRPWDHSLRDRLRVIDELKPGDVWEDKGFMSLTGLSVSSRDELESLTSGALEGIPASYNRRWSERRSGRITTVAISYSGSQARHISKWSNTASEDEYLLPRSTKLRVSGVTRDTSNPLEEIVFVTLED